MDSEKKTQDGVLTPSTLEKISEQLRTQGVDISKIVDLSEYLNDKLTAEMLADASFENLENSAAFGLMEHLIPLLDEKSKTTLFSKVIEGQLDWHYLKIMMPYITYLRWHIESAYIEGALPAEVMTWLNDAIADEARNWTEDM
ncbi:MAG: hypothetical protein K6G29_05815 [Clostridiales bacterium]|nr:hypothetical protein [Clostridia bacterium]MCR5681954.1 hypothetical protein [Clostridiales bacterium]